MGDPPLTEGRDDLTAAEAGALGAPRVHLFDAVASTLDEIHRLATLGAPQGTLVVADEQTAGRGQQGRIWHSPRGGLWLGFLARPVGEGVAGAFAIRVGLAVVEVLAASARPGTDLALKWPNDILLGGKKAAGILCEARWLDNALRWIAVGIGVNLHHPIPAEVAETATAVSGATRGGVLRGLVPALLEAASSRGLLTSQELARFDRWDALRGRRLIRPVAGIATGLRSDGSLLVETEHGTTSVRSGSVRLA